MVITIVERWMTSDGKEHCFSVQAVEWEAKLFEAAKATEMLEGGSSVADCLRAMHYTPDIDPILELVTKDTKLVISHWQGRDTPGYKVCWFMADGNMYVFGDAGSLTGPDGGPVNIDSLVQYAKDKNTQLQPSEQTT